MKTEVYSWRVSPELKAELEKAAREERVSVAKLLERITRGWLEERKAEASDDEAEQARIRAAAAPYIGAFTGDDPYRSEKVRELVRERLTKRRDG
jgi:hypothetical protein